MQKLTKEDWNFILDALEEYKSKNLKGEMLSHMLGSIGNNIFKNDTEALMRLKDEEEKEQKERDKETEQIKKRVDLIKAKIILGREDGTNN